MNGPRFSNIFQPLRIGRMDIRNRIVMPAMVTSCADLEGHVTSRLKSYYEARARGGVGLIILEASYVHLRGRIWPYQLAINGDELVPGLSELVKILQKHGTKVAVQLNHGGRLASSKFSGLQPLAPSSIPSAGGEVPEEVSVDEIVEMAAFFAQAARRAKQAGFDAIEINATPEFLIGQFLSHVSNKRKDAYGGDLKNRARFLVEVIKAVRGVVDADYPVWCRLGGKDEEGGISVTEAQEIARIAQEAGSQAIHLYASSSGSPHMVTERPLTSPLLVYLAEGIKKVVTVPLIAVGAISSEDGERILQEQKADLISIGKALIADPDLPNKVASGNLDDIIPCIVCLECINRVVFKDSHIECSVNARTGWEGECTIQPTEKPRKVLVIGGGPAGMEAARVAALRGNQVWLYDKENKLGGQLIHAAAAPHKEKIEPLTKYLETQIKKLGIKIGLGKEVTAAFVEQVKPDAVVIATGSTPIIPEIPGVRGNNVATALEVLSGRKNVGERVVIVGGGMVGCETAEFLAERHKKIIILEMLKEIGSDMVPSLRPLTLARLKSAAVRMETGIKVVEITDKGVMGLRDGRSEFIEAETIVLAMGMSSQRQLAEDLKGKTGELHLAGDCVKPQRIREAIADGFRVACEL